MRRVKGADTTPERLVSSALHARGHRFRLHVRDLPGRPDIVFRGDRLAIFVHGCFWHRHPGCPHCRMPKSRGKRGRQTALLLSAALLIGEFAGVAAGGNGGDGAAGEAFVNVVGVIRAAIPFA